MLTFNILASNGLALKSGRALWQELRRNEPKLGFKWNETNLPFLHWTDGASTWAHPSSERARRFSVHFKSCEFQLAPID